MPHVRCLPAQSSSGPLGGGTVTIRSSGKLTGAPIELGLNTQPPHLHLLKHRTQGLAYSRCSIHVAAPPSRAQEHVVEPEAFAEHKLNSGAWGCFRGGGAALSSALSWALTLPLCFPPGCPRSASQTTVPTNATWVSTTAPRGRRWSWHQATSFSTSWVSAGPSPAPGSQRGETNEALTEE